MIPTKRVNGKVCGRTALPCCCGGTHATWKTWAQCFWRTARSVDNDPPLDGDCWAVLAHCGRPEGGGVGPALILLADLDEARQRWKFLLRFGCSSACRRHPDYHTIQALHQVVRSGAYRRDAPLVWQSPLAHLLAEFDRREAVKADAAGGR